MPATNFAAVSRMAGRCGASIPSWLSERFDGLDDDPHTRTLIAAIIAARQIEELRCEGFDEFHFYTLNQADVVSAVCRLLNLEPRVREREAA
jgi:methylenetetrahydrofolate reductase (NADPH)